MDGKPVPRIIDFGLAKATALPGQTLFTRAFLGTPGYMSPSKQIPNCTMLTRAPMSTPRRSAI